MTREVFRQGKRGPIFDAEAEGLVVRAKAGDKAALEELVGRYMRLIVVVAHGYDSPTNPFDDLVQEGVIALMHCIVGYSPGLSFGRYFTCALRNHYRKLVRYEGVRSRGWVGSLDSDESELPEPVDEKAEGSISGLVSARVAKGEFERRSAGVDARDAFLVKLAAGALTEKGQGLSAMAAVLGTSSSTAEAKVRQAKERYRGVYEGSEASV